MTPIFRRLILIGAACAAPAAAQRFEDLDQLEGQVVAMLGAGIYQDRMAVHGISSLEPDEAMQAAVDRAIAHVKAGSLEQARTEFVPVALAMLDRGADAVLLACTELPLVPCPAELRGKLVDPTMALARAIVAHSRGAPCEPPGADVS